MSVTIAVGVPWQGTGIPMFLLGCVIVLGTASSVIRTLIVTRGMNSIIARSLQAIPSSVLRFTARRFRSYERRDAILSWVPSLSIVSMLLGWLVLFLVGYSLIIFGSSNLAFWDSMRQAGSSLFTLGFAAGYLPELTAFDFLAAATGPIVIALMIGYLPTLYSAYNHRELAVSLLKSRAGAPNWGPEFLARAALIGSTEHLDAIWSEWEKWSADVSESHSTYPILIYTRSARPDRSWLIALLSILDSAALSLALNPGLRQTVPRLVLRQGVECMRDLARACELDFDPNPGPTTPIQLTYEEFAHAVDMLDTAGYEHERSAEDAWEYFRQWRLVYEEPAYKLAMHLDAVPALWSGPRKPPSPPIPPKRPRYIVRNPDGSLDLPQAELALDPDDRNA